MTTARQSLQMPFDSVESIINSPSLSTSTVIRSKPKPICEHYWMNLKRVPFTPEELEPAIIQESTTRQALYDNPQTQASGIGYLVGSSQPWQLIDLEVAQLRSVTTQDVQRAVNACFTRERATVAHVFPIEKKTSA